MVRDILRNAGLQADKDFSQYSWQIWAGDSDRQIDRILQENGSNPRIRDYADGLMTGFEQQLRSSPGMIPRYFCRIWYSEAIVPLISEKAWYWLSKDNGQTFEKLRVMLLRDGSGPQFLKWEMVLGETKIKRSL